MRVTKQQALKIAQTASQITVSDTSLGMSNEPTTLERFLREVAQFAGKSFRAWQQGNVLLVDFAGIHFEVKYEVEEVTHHDC